MRILKKRVDFSAPYAIIQTVEGHGVQRRRRQTDRSGEKMPDTKPGLAAIIRTVEGTTPRLTKEKKRKHEDH